MRARQLVDMGKRRNVDKLCLQYVRWTGSKVGWSGGESKLYSHGGDAELQKEPS